MLYDNHNRPLNYLRLAVTDRCNLRCNYCMPEEGLEWLSRKELMTYEEMLYISNLFIELGVHKIRITGGEPFVRKDIDKFIAELSKNEKLNQIHLTTNGVLTSAFIPNFDSWKIRSCNLSLDTLQRERFFEITRRDDFDAVIKTLDSLMTFGVKTKINMVVMSGKNEDEIEAMCLLTKDNPIDVRFIEEMPFNGDGHQFSGISLNYHYILNHIKTYFPAIQSIENEPNATAFDFQIPNFKGKIGIIPAYSRSFCGTCNRIRLTPDGGLKTCLYGPNVLNVKDLMRGNLDKNDLVKSLISVFKQRAKDGFEAESLKNHLGHYESMATIGG